MAKNPTSKTSSKKKKTAAPKKKEEKKTKTSKKTKAASGSSAKAGAGEKSAAEPVTLQELLARRFAPLEARTPVKVPPPDISSERFSAPPFFEADSPAEAERLREVLGRRFDYEAIKAAAEKAAPKKDAAQKAAVKKPTPKKAPAKPVTTRELLARRFTPLEARAPVKVPPPDISSARFSAPPFLEADSPAEAERLRTVLGRRFDYEAIKAAAEKAAAEKAAAEKAAAEKAAAEKAAAEKAAAEKAAREGRRRKGRR
jgi:aromatic ring-cleaving dioxygenase